MEVLRPIEFNFVGNELRDERMGYVFEEREAFFSQER